MAAVCLKTGSVENQDINSVFGANKEIRRTHDTSVGDSELGSAPVILSGSDTETHLTCADL